MALCACMPGSCPEARLRLKGAGSPQGEQRTRRAKLERIVVVLEHRGLFVVADASGVR